MQKELAKAVFIGIAVIIIASVGMPFVMVDTGHRGIKVQFGEVIGEPLPEGVHWKKPFVEEVIEFDTRTKRLDEATDTYTKDVQKVQVSYVVNYNLKRTAVGDVFKEVGPKYEDVLLIPSLRASIKETIGKWNAVELVENRGKAASEVQTHLTAELDPKGVTITNFEIVTVKFDAEFEQAVEAKVKAVELAKKAKNVTVQVQEQAKQKVIAAEAEARAMRIKTQALAQSPTLVKYEAVQKWDGKLPVNLYGSAPIPFLNIGR